MTREELEKEYRKLAKRADQRLVRLEKLSQEEGYSVATQWGYRKAMKDIRKWSGEDARRFNTAPPKDDRELFLKVQEIKEFLDPNKTPSTTKSGILNIYKKKADTINERYGTNFTWDQLAKFMQKDTFSKMESKLASKTVLRAIGLMQRHKDELIDGINKAAADIIMGDPSSDIVLINTLRDQGFSDSDIDAISKIANGEGSMDDIITAANALDVDLPGNPQDRRNINKLAMAGVDWGEILE